MRVSSVNQGGPSANQSGGRSANGSPSVAKIVRLFLGALFLSPAQSLPQLRGENPNPYNCSLMTIRNPTNRGYSVGCVIPSEISEVLKHNEEVLRKQEKMEKLRKKLQNGAV